jgi:hypothetical protein
MILWLTYGSVKAIVALNQTRHVWETSKEMYSQLFFKFNIFEMFWSYWLQFFVLLLVIVIVVCAFIVLSSFAVLTRNGQFLSCAIIESFYVKDIYCSIVPVNLSLRPEFNLSVNIAKKLYSTRKRTWLRKTVRSYFFFFRNKNTSVL